MLLALNQSTRLSSLRSSHRMNRRYIHQPKTTKWKDLSHSKIHLHTIKTPFLKLHKAMRIASQMLMTSIIDKINKNWYRVKTIRRLKQPMWLTTLNSTNVRRKTTFNMRTASKEFQLFHVRPVPPTF